MKQNSATIPDDEIAMRKQPRELCQIGVVDVTTADKLYALMRLTRLSQGNLIDEALDLFAMDRRLTEDPLMPEIDWKKRHAHRLNGKHGLCFSATAVHQPFGPQTS